jgi:hypothetical protein
MSALGLAAGSVDSRAKAQMGGSTGSMLPCNDEEGPAVVQALPHRGPSYMRCVSAQCDHRRAILQIFAFPKKHEKDACMHRCALTVGLSPRERTSF